MKKYLIKDNVEIVFGAHGSALYDNRVGDVFAFNDVATQIIKESLGKSKQNKFMDALVAQGYLKFAEGKLKKENTNDFSVVQSLKRGMVWLELVPTCNLRCLHCYGSFSPDECLKDNKRLLAFEDWQRAIEQLYRMGSRSIQFTGGEPLIYKRLKELIIFAKKIGFRQIEIFSNATLLDEEWIKFLAKNKISIAVSLYSTDGEIHDEITGLKNSFTRTKKNLLLLKKYKVECRLSTIIMKNNEKTVDEVINFAKKMNFGHKCDIVRPSGRGKDTLCPSVAVQERFRNLRKPSFSTTLSQFNNNKTRNSCWNGLLAITATGDVIPCIFARNQIAGNIFENQLEDIIREKMVGYWSITKDNVKGCSDCEFRYACNDCRPYSYSESGDLYQKPSWCKYDPKTGIWEQKIDQLRSGRG
jgi:radical SAM protein with 4Fe4S-binding SPASM domain